MLPPDTTTIHVAPCPTCGQPAAWYYDALAEGDLCYCLCQAPTLAWVPADPPVPPLRTAARTAWAQTPAAPAD
ncbi:MAG: hypothetical protein M3Z04_02640, partial [Chloroflexota bacterium]|nr:hypothetical protein [Chloroflexota bacterium]